MKKAVLAAIFALAMIFTLSCGNGEGAAEGGSGGTETLWADRRKSRSRRPRRENRNACQSNGAGSGGSGRGQLAPMPHLNRLTLTESLLPAIFLPVAS